MKLNTMYLDMIRDKIDSFIKNGKSIKIDGTFIADNLSRAYEGKTFQVDFVKIEPSNKTFVMCCYPDIDELNNMVRPFMDKLNDGKTAEFASMWKGVKKWHIEIDQRVIQKGNPLCVDNGSQFVAMLCHELGHIMNKFPISLSLNYKYNKAKSNAISKLLMTEPGRVILILCLPMFVCVNGIRFIVSKPGHDLGEYIADASVPDQYKPYLVEYTNNHIITNPETASGIVVTQQEYDSEQQAGIEFSRSCINLMKARSAALTLHLATFGKLSPSKYLQNFGTFMASKIDPVNLKEKYIANESFNTDIANAERKAETLLESRADVSDRDILLLQVEIDSMKTFDDKTYVINTICDYIEKFEHKKAKLIKKCKDPNNIPTITMYDEKLATLNRMKTQVMATKITTNDNDYSSDYGINIKYPKGYEG